MLKSFSKLAMTIGAAAAIATGTAAPRPVMAQSQGTINTLLGAAAVVGGIILYNNYVHKKQAANTVVGYTANGGTVYGDGRIVMPNGRTYYPNANGVYPWGTPAYYSPRANPRAYTYDYARTGRWDHTGRHRGHAYGHANPHNPHAYGAPPYGPASRHPQNDRDDNGHAKGGDDHDRGHDHG
jgi:hypothetical protein